eukprot:53467-Pelagomonas_calceolata.AAC.3
MGTNLLLFQFSIHLHTQHNEKLIRGKVMGQKLSSGRPYIPALPGTHNWLVCPQTALLSSPSNNALYVVTILEVWIGLLHLCIYTLATHTLARMALTPSHAHKPLLLPNLH